MYKMNAIRLRILSRLQNLQMKNVNWMKNKQYVLMFHSICERPNWYDRDYCMTPRTFENMIIELERRRCQFLPIEMLQHREDSKEVYLTFDDGFLDFYENAYPILKKHHIPFTIFLTLDYINKRNYLTWEQILELSENSLCTIGCHTYTHKQLSECSITELRKEIIIAKEKMEEKLKKEVNFFAYPYGTLHKVHLCAPLFVWGAGYRKAFSTLATPVNSSSRYFIPRINMNERNWKLQIVHCI